MVPTVELPPVTPLTCQVTAMLFPSFTGAVNCCEPLTACTFADAGATATLIGGGGGIAVGHALLPALDGAVEVVLTVEITTSAVSVLPASSVTVRRTVVVPDVGALLKVVAAVFGGLKDPAP